MSTTAAMRVPAFRRLMIALTFSHLGTWLQITAASWVVLQATGSSYWVGLVTATGIIPQTVLAIPGGVLADRKDRRLSLLVGNATAAVAAATLALTPTDGKAVAILIVATSLVVGIATSVTQPASLTYIPDLVGRPLLGGAIAAQAMSYNLAKVLGPGIGAAFVAIGHPRLAFALNAVSFASVAVVLWFAPADTAEKQPPGRTGLTRRAFERARSDAALLHPLIVTAIYGATGMCFQTLLPDLIASRGGNAGRYGLLLLTFGVGGITGAAVRSRLAPRAGSAGTALGVGVLGVCALGMAAAPLSLAAFPTAFFAGGSWVWTHNSTQRRVQLNAPWELRGRLMALYSFATFGPLSIGILVAGAVADRTSPAFALATLAGSNALFGLALGVRAARRNVTRRPGGWFRAAAVRVTRREA